MQGGLNAFHLCIQSGHLDVAHYLAVEMGTHLYDTDDKGATALHLAVEMNHLTLVEYLVKSCEFDVTARDKVCKSKFVNDIPNILFACL